MINVAVIHHSTTGNVYALAQGIAEGARGAGAEVRLLKVPELADAEAIARNPKWAAHMERTAGVGEATLDDLLWADAAIFGSPTRFSNVTWQMKHYIDQAGALWMQGKLVDKVVSGFTSASTPHGGPREHAHRAVQHVLQLGLHHRPTGLRGPRAVQGGDAVRRDTCECGRGRPR